MQQMNPTIDPQELPGPFLTDLDRDMEAVKQVTQTMSAHDATVAELKSDINLAMTEEARLNVRNLINADEYNDICEAAISSPAKVAEYVQNAQKYELNPTRFHKSCVDMLNPAYDP